MIQKNGSTHTQKSGNHSGEPRLRDLWNNLKHTNTHIIGAPEGGVVVKNLPANAGDARDMGSILGWEDPLEKEMATHSSILVWKFPQTEHGRLQSTESQTIRHG